jgi:hypothetical protein
MLAHIDRFVSSSTDVLSHRHGHPEPPDAPVGALSGPPPRSSSTVPRHRPPERGSCALRTRRRGPRTGRRNESGRR